MTTLNAIFFNASQMSNLTILLGYMAILIVLGAIISLKTTTPSSFMLGNRSFPGWLLAFSLTGTSISSMAFLAFPARGYSLDFGLISANCAAEFLGLAFAGIFFVRFLRRTPDASIYTQLNQRFGSWASIFASTSFIVYSLFRMGVIMCLVAKAIHMISGSSTGGVILLCGIIVIFYTYMAGIEGVIWTDLIQTLFLIIAGATCLYFIISLLPKGVDSGINSSATAFISNIYHPYIKQGKRSSSSSMDTLRRSSLIFGALGVTIAYFVFISGESVLSIYWKWTPVFSTGVFGLFLLMRLFKRVGALAGGIAALVGSSVTAWISFTGGKDLPFAAPFHYMLNYPLGILTIISTGFVFSFAFKRTNKEEPHIEHDETTGEEYVERVVNTEYHLIKNHALANALQPNPYYQALGVAGAVFYLLTWLEVFPVKIIPQDSKWLILGISSSLLLALTPISKNDSQNKCHSLFVLGLLGLALPLIGAILFFAHPDELFFNYFFMATIAILGAFVEWVVLGFLVSIATCAATLIASASYSSIGIPGNWLTLTSGCLGIMTLYAMSSARRSLREREKLEGIAMLSHTLSTNIPEKNSRLNRLIASTANFLENGKPGGEDYTEEWLSMKDCLQAALRQYPLEGQVRDFTEINIKSDIIIKGSNELVINCFLHLIDNPYYYIRSHKATKLRCTIDGTRREIILEDDGPGIPPRNIPYIFELFFSSGKLGPGMGLTYCRRALQLMGATIHLSSKQESSHTEFTLSFPQNEPPLDKK